MNSRLISLQSASAIAAIAVSNCSVNAQMISMTNPPPVQFIDSNGVDLRSGEWVRRGGEFSIGAEGSPRLSHAFSKTSKGAYTGTPVEGIVYKQACDPELPPGEYNNCMLQESTYWLDGMGDVSRPDDRVIEGTTVIDADGTRYVFDEAYGSPNGWGFYIQAKISQIIYPNGYMIRYRYNTGTNPATLVSIDDNTGLYSSTLKLINLSYDYCAQGTVCTAGSHAWPSVSRADIYANNSPITDPAGGVWTGTKEQAGPGIVTSTRTDPAGNQEHATLRQYGANNYFVTPPLVNTITKGGKQFTYEYTYRVTSPTTMGIATTIRTDPDGKKTKYERLSAGKYKITDENGFGKIYEYAILPARTGDTEEIDGKLISVTMPENNKYNYFYGVRRNHVSTLYTNKNGTQTQIYGATFAATCTERLICNRPITQTDANGNTTSFTYYPEHGGVKRVQKPAVGGISPVIRYNYVQRRAWIKNASGGYSADPAPIWLLNDERTCRTTATVGESCQGGAGDEVVTSYEYGPNSGPNNLWLRGKAVAANGVTSRTCYGYDVFGNRISETSASASLSVCP